MLKLKQWISLGLCIILLCTAFPFALAADQEVADSAISRVQFNLRKGRGTDTGIVCNVPRNKKLIVMQYYDDEWCKAKYSYWTGYAKVEWLKFPDGSSRDPKPTPAPTEAVQAAEPTPEPEEDESDADDEPIPTAEASSDTRGKWVTPTPTDAPVKPTLTSFDPRIAKPVPCGISIGESDTDEIAYVANTTAVFNIRETPSDDGRRLFEMKKGKRINVLAYGDDWCKVQTRNGAYTGYCKTKFLYHFHSCDPFKYDIPWYNGYKSTGYIYFTEPVHITDHKDTYGGQDMQVGDVVTVQKRTDGDYDFILRRDWITLSEYVGEYHAFVPWNQAKEGDIIGGYTMHFGLLQGGAFKKARRHNIALAISHMDGTITKSGERYSFLTNIGPVTTGQGYKTAGITGGDGIGIGGGVCHTSSVTYSAALSVPFYIYEREPHTADGTAYTLLEFDATVGGYSDMIYYNTLPYDIKEHAYLNRTNGTMTILWECLETLDQSVLDNWDWKTLNIPKSPEENS